MGCRPSDLNPFIISELYKTFSQSILLYGFEVLNYSSIAINEVNIIKEQKFFKIFFESHIFLQLHDLKRLIFIIIETQVIIYYAKLITRRGSMNI